MVGEESVSHSVALGGTVDEPATEFDDACAAVEGRLAKAAQKVRFHLHCDRSFLQFNAGIDGEPHGHVRGGNENRAADNAIGPFEPGTTGDADGAPARAEGMNAKTVASEERCPVEQILEVFAGCGHGGFDAAQAKKKSSELAM